MKFPTSTRFLLAFAASILASATFAQAQYSNGQNAYILWGQPTFSSAAAGTTNSTFTSPTDFAIDPTTGKFFVVDSGNNRILRFQSSYAYSNGVAAEAVFGQPDYTTQAAGTPVSASTLKTPTAAVIDSQGTLWVADSANNRVLGFQNASSITTNGSPADFFFGQPSTSSFASATTSSGMKTPTGVAVDGNGSLYVVDTGNNRILKFTDPNVVGNGSTAINADSQFGQINYLVGTAGTTQSTFTAPSYAKVDGSGNLWVSDTGNNRVLLFSSIASASAGASASLVLGQSSFLTSTSAPTTQASLKGPTGITFGPLGSVYVADTGNNRVLIYETATSSGASATLVLGQPDFTSSGAAASQTGLSAPTGISYSNFLLWAADKTNNRVINYVLSPGIPAIVVPSTVKLNANRLIISSTFYIANTSANFDIFKAVVVIPGSAKKLATYSFTYNGQNVTNALLAGTFTTPLFKSSQLPITVKIAPKSKAQKKGGTIQLTITATSNTSGQSASGIFQGKFKKPKN